MRIDRTGTWASKLKLAILLLAVLSALGPRVTAGATVIKLATLVPEGSVWDKALRTMGEDWKRGTSGRVTLRIYPGGVAGSEGDVVRKLRIGQLQAGAVTTVGLEDIDPAFKILTVPLFYESYEELAHVLDGLAPELSRRLESKGFVLLHWANAGWAHLFSRNPLHTIEDLRQFKIYVPAGSKDIAEWWKRNGFRPVELASVDIMTGLQTGMIDVLPTPPLAALSLQWFRQTPFMHDLGVAPVTGATIVLKRVWDKLEAADRDALLRSAAAVERTLADEIPGQEMQAIEEMKRRGLEVTASEDLTGWRRAAEDFGAAARGTSVPGEIYDRALALREEFRRRTSAGGES